MKLINHIFVKHRSTALALMAVFIFAVLLKVSAVSGGPFTTGETLNPDCLPGAVNCVVTAGGLGGSGTLNYVPKFSPDGTTLDDSLIFDDGTTVFINNNVATYGERLNVNGNVYLGVNPSNTVYSTKLQLVGSSSSLAFDNNWGVDKIIFRNDVIQKITTDASGNFDWLLAGKNFAFSDVGKVGIGTATPGATLDIQGEGLTSATFGLKVSNLSGTNTNLVVRDDGNVGIGTVSPVTKLQVVGGSGQGVYATSTNDIAVNGTAIGASSFGIKGESDLGTAIRGNVTNTSAIGLDIVDTTSGDTLLKVQGDGNVGIGIAVPTSKLHISSNGDSGIANYSITSLGTSAYTGWSDLGASTLSLYGAMTGYGTSIASGLYVYENGYTPKFTLTTNSANGRTAFNSTDRPIFITYNETNGLIINTDGTQYITGGNFGIGQSSPIAKLDIAGGSVSGATELLRITGEIPFTLANRTVFSVNNSGRVVAGIDNATVASTFGHVFLTPNGSTEAFRITDSVGSAPYFYLETDGSFALGTIAGPVSFLSGDGAGSFKLEGSIHQHLNINSPNVGPTLRVRGETDDNTKYVAYFESLSNNLLFNIKNDGNVSINAGNLQIGDSGLTKGITLYDTTSPTSAYCVTIASGALAVGVGACP